MLSYQSGDGREVGRDARLLPVEADVAHVVFGRQRILELASCLFHGGPAVLHNLVFTVRAAVEYLRRSKGVQACDKLRLNSTMLGIKLPRGDAHCEGISA